MRVFFLATKESQVVTTLKQVSLGLILLVVCPALRADAEKTSEAPQKAALMGLWEGEYSYPQDTMQEPVKFKLVLIQDGNTVAGFIKEPNTFGQRKEPHLHAVFKGTFDPKTAKLTFTKTYDGTAGVEHDVEYSGDLSKDGKKVEGKWTLEGANGNFTLERKTLNKETLEGLK
jgi:hypothetical protein